MPSDLTVRNARLSDAQAISELINSYARQNVMLPRNPDVILENIRNFFVAEAGGRIAGCCAVSFFTEELAEIRSLAVREEWRGRGVGKLLVGQAESVLKEEGIRCAFVLTYSGPFFEKLGYRTVDKNRFPQKIWRDCMNCPKIMRCDEIAMEKCF